MSVSYIPSPPAQAIEPSSYTFVELQDLVRALNEAQQFTWLQTLHAEPIRPRDGMIVLADGTDWDPGSGAGAYSYHAGTWYYLEAGGGGSGANLTWTASTRTVASDTGSDAVITLFTSTDAGLAPASGGGTTNFLRADGNWAAPTLVPAGSDTQIQWNNAGALGAEASFTYDDSVNRIALAQTTLFDDPNPYLSILPDTFTYTYGTFSTNAQITTIGSTFAGGIPEFADRSHVWIGGPISNTAGGTIYDSILMSESLYFGTRTGPGTTKTVFRPLARGGPQDGFDETLEVEIDGVTTYMGLLPFSGGGAMATDVLWDAKGDLAVATGANTAIKQPVGANNTVLTADSSTGTGIKWAALPTLDAISAPVASVDFDDQQALSFRIENRTSDPGTPTTGQIWLRTDL